MFNMDCEPDISAFRDYLHTLKCFSPKKKEYKNVFLYCPNTDHTPWAYFVKYFQGSWIFTVAQENEKSRQGEEGIT